MAFVHSNSCDCSKSELDLFSLPPTQTHIESGGWVQYKPVSSVNESSSLEFVVPGQGDEYIDLSHTLLGIKAKIVKKADGAALAAADDDIVGPVNNWLHSLFSQVDTYLNQKIVSSPSNAYPYRSYLESLLSYGPAAKNSHVTCNLWVKDEPGKMDAADSAGLKARRAFTKRSKTVDMIGKVHGDLFNQEKYLLNGVELRLKFVRSRDVFCLIANANDYKINIIEATLYVRRVKVSPTILLNHARALEKTTAKYPITRVDVRTNTIAAGVQSASLDNLVNGQLPTRIIVGLVSNAAFTGSITTNPFNFETFGMNYVSFHVDGQQIPGMILTPDFDNNEYIRAYHTLFSGTGIHYSDSGNEISRSDYQEGYALIALDFTPDLEAHVKSHWSLVRHGNLRLELRFKAALANAVTIVSYAEFDNVVEIDRNRNVIVDFGA